MQPADQAAALAEGVLGGDRRALARAISMVEDDRPGADELLRLLYPKGGRSHVVGVTGAPGSGKSTLVDRLIEHLRGEGRQVGVIAVDPSSPFTGGALLGDRIRMQRHISDPGVFVRSMSSRGRLGGLADATSKALALMEAARFDPILIETVGVGQSEVEVMEVADTTVVVLAPGWGDEIQTAKAGILEGADVFCVNKDDLPGADQLVAALTLMLDLVPEEAPLRPPIVRCSSQEGRGIDELWRAVEHHRSSPGFAERRRRRAAAELRRAVAARLAAAVEERIEPDLVAAICDRRLDPWSAAAELVGGSG